MNDTNGKQQKAERFLLEQCLEILDEAGILWVELAAYLDGSATVDDILETMEYGRNRSIENEGSSAGAK